MNFDTNNKIVKLCIKGMELEGSGKMEDAKRLFLQAWEEAITEIEKFTAAHYVARHQKTITDKLKWDETALTFALKINNEAIKANYPSLYLNIAKCHEELNDFANAKKNYKLALSYTGLLSDDGYGNMIKSGIKNGLERVGLNQ